jgi:hypothetical protein
MPYFNFNRSTKETPRVQVSVEYLAPHWVIFIRNPGQAAWTPVRDGTKKVRIQDEFGSDIRSYPAIQAFSTQEAAEQWVKDNVGSHDRAARQTSGVRALFAAPIQSPAQQNN